MGDSQMMKREHQRFPRLDLQHVLENIPRLDLSKVKDSHPLIDNFVVEGCTQVGYGKFGTRKTTIHLLAAWAVSQGIPFLGKKTRQRMVLYLDYENPAGVLKQYCKDLGINPDDPRFTVWDRTKEYPPLPGDEMLDRFIRRCKKATGDSPWIIFDSWTSLLRTGHSGNDIGEATPIFQAIRKYCDQGATCTIIDHTGKKGNDPIGTSAKMTQMDTAHFFSVQEDEISLDGRSSRAVIRIENFLKRFAPKDVGTFSIEIKAAMNEKDEWHTRSVEPTKDKAVIKQEKEIEGMKQLIRDNPSLGQEDLAKLAAQEKIVSGRDRTRRLLQDGLGKHWKSLPRSHGKMTFRVLK
jgi:RecA-family ATPase